MSEVIQIDREDEHSIRPYKYFVEYGDCADSVSVKNVDKATFADQFSFRVARRIKVKHAP